MDKLNPHTHTFTYVSNQALGDCFEHLIDKLDMVDIYAPTWGDGGVGIFIRIFLVFSIDIIVLDLWR